jgi:prolyl oligopeptidase
MYKTLSAIGLSLLALSACKPNQSSQTAIMLKYPETKKVEQTDDYFGTKVTDPYRWLENDTSAETKAWVDAENKVTHDYLNQMPDLAKIKQRITDLVNYPKYSSPFRAGEYYFFSKNDGLQNQSVIYFQKGIDGEPKVFLDPNKMSSDGTAAVALAGFSKDRKYVCYTVNQSGSDWQKMYVMEVATQKLMSESLD